MRRNDNPNAPHRIKGQYSGCFLHFSIIIKIPQSLLTARQPYFLKVDYTNSEEGWPGYRRGHQNRPERSEVGGASVRDEEAALHGHSPELLFPSLEERDRILTRFGHW